MPSVLERIHRLVQLCRSNSVQLTRRVRLDNPGAGLAELSCSTLGNHSRVPRVVRSHDGVLLGR